MYIVNDTINYYKEFGLKPEDNVLKDFLLKKLFYYHRKYIKILEENEFNFISDRVYFKNQIRVEHNSNISFISKNDIFTKEFINNPINIGNISAFFILKMLKEFESGNTYIICKNKKNVDVINLTIKFTSK